MKLPDLPLPRVDVPRLGLASFRRRLLIRAVFLLLALATIALAVALLQDEKERGLRSYQQNFRKTEADVMARLRQPAGQLALLNPYPATEVTPLRPLVLPYPSLDFDDPAKAVQAVDLAGCSTIYPDDAALCAGVGSNAYAGGFLYLVGSFVGGELTGREPDDAGLGEGNRARIRLEMRGEVRSWIAAFERQSMRGEPLVRGRLVAYPANADGVVANAPPVRDFRGWMWQSATCSAGGELPDCPRRVSYAIRLPVEAFRAALGTARPTWPPPDLDRIRVHLQMLAPGGNVAFDSNAAGAVAPGSVQDLGRLLQPGETLTLARAGAPQPLAVLHANDDARGRTSPLILRLIDRLPVTVRPGPVAARDTVTTPLGAFDVRLTGDAEGVARGLGAVATRMSWYVGAMLAAIVLAWIAIEVGIIRRIAVLTRRAAAVSHKMQQDAAGGIAELDVSDLRGRDELGILAGGLADLLQRVKGDVQREQVRAQRERDMLQAVGHEILSPLQSLMVLHPDPADPAHRYVQRMQQAVRVLYGQASPSEALQAAQLELSPLDLDAFLREVAANAAYAAIDDVRYTPAGQPLTVRADPFSLEDVVTHILRNADRHRRRGTPITLSLARADGRALVQVHNCGPAVPEDRLESIFDYGVSEAGAEGGRRGQGLFVVRTYLAKMGGSARCRNVADGVVFELALPLQG